MANPEHLKILKQGVEAQEKTNGSVPAEMEEQKCPSNLSVRDRKDDC